jgi:hypothetical protein
VSHIAEEANLLDNNPWSVMTNVFNWYQKMNINLFSTLASFFLGTGVTVFNVMSLVWSTISSARDFVLGIAVFVATVYYLLSSEEFFLDKLVLSK